MNFDKVDVKDVVIISRTYYVYEDRQMYRDEFIEFGGLEEALEHINTTTDKKTIVGLFKRIHTKVDLK